MSSEKAGYSPGDLFMAEQEIFLPLFNDDTKI